MGGKGLIPELDLLIKWMTHTFSESKKSYDILRDKMFLIFSNLATKCFWNVFLIIGCKHYNEQKLLPRFCKKHAKNRSATKYKKW